MPDQSLNSGARDRHGADRLRPRLDRGSGDLQPARRPPGRRLPDRLRGDRASGATGARPELAPALARIRARRIRWSPGSTGWPARWSHLLEVIERVEAVGEHFKSLRDPIDTSTPQGRFALQVLGAAARAGRALIRSGSGRGCGRRRRGAGLGQPGLRAARPEASASFSALRDRQYMAELLATLEPGCPGCARCGRRIRGARSAKVLGRLGSPDRPVEADRLSRAVRRLVSEGLAEPALIEPAPRRPPKDDILLVIAGIKGADPDTSLRAIATPPGGDAHPRAARRDELVGLVGQGAARPRRTVGPRHSR